jgi:hypothetical protein
MTTKPKPQHVRAGNPYVTLRAKTIQSKKRVASKRACRGRVQVES